MNFSYEELYYMYGQYDTNINITFHYQSESFKRFGSTLMGTIIYTEDDRNEVEELLKKEPVLRTDKKIRLLPSSVEKLNKEQFEQAERYGFLCSDIYEVLSYNKPRKNNFTEKGKKEIENSITVNLTGWKRQNLNLLIYGFLNSRFEKGNQLSPNELNKYLGLRKYFE